jgi:hypothetical protein
MSTSMAIGVYTAGPALLAMFVPALARLRPEAGPVVDAPKDEPATEKAGKGEKDA